MICEIIRETFKGLLKPIYATIHFQFCYRMFQIACNLTKKEDWILFVRKWMEMSPNGLVHVLFTCLRKLLQDGGIFFKSGTQQFVTYSVTTVTFCHPLVLLLST